MSFVGLQVFLSSPPWKLLDAVEEMVGLGCHLNAPLSSYSSKCEFLVRFAS